MSTISNFFLFLVKKNIYSTNCGSLSSENNEIFRVPILISSIFIVILMKESERQIQVINME